MSLGQAMVKPQGQLAGPPTDLLTPLRVCVCVCVCVWQREREREHIGEGSNFVHISFISFNLILIILSVFSFAVFNINVV